MKRQSNRRGKLNTIIYSCVLMSVAMLTIASCSTSNTAKEDRFVHYSQFKKYRKKSKTVTKPLFMQSSTVDVALLEKGDFKNMYNIPEPAKKLHGLVLPEDDYLLEFVDIPGFTQAVRKDTVAQDSVESRTYKYLTSIPYVFEVLNNPDKRFVSERNGNIKLDFKVVVPRHMISDRWRIVMRPQLLGTDNTLNLAPLKITGDEFARKQQLDDENYQKFLRSLVLRGNYSEVFVDRKRTEKELRKLQEFYWNSYHKEWSKYVKYEKWKFDREDQDAFYAGKRLGKDKKTYHDNALTALNMVARDYSAGKDTTGLFDKYLTELQAKSKKYFTPGSEKATLPADEIAKRYRENYASGKKAKDVTNLTTSPLDSIRLASHLYDYDEVALNEVTIARLKEIREEILKYPLDEGDTFILDSVGVNNNNDFVYHYSKTLPVETNIDSLRLVMNSKVEAVDLSTYTMAPSDTLTYYVTNMNQLVDSTLSATKVRIFRNVYDLLTIQPKYKVGRAEFDINFGDNRAQADSVFNAYNRNRYERGLTIDSVILKGSASLEGAYEKNLDLSRRRSTGMKDFLKRVMPPETDVENTFIARYIGEDWQGMKREIQAHPRIQNKEAILDMLNNSVFPDQTEQDIRRKYKSDYAIIMNDIYPKLRKIDIVFNMSRPSMGVADSVFSEVNTQYVNALSLVESGDYKGALETLEEYQDYNTALCYANLNEYEKAYDLLRKIEKNGYSEYLAAIVAYHLGKKQDGAHHLLEACKHDFRQAYRILADNEATALVTEYSLQDEIKELLKAADAPVLPEVKIKDIEVTEGPGGVEGVSKYNPEEDERVGSRVTDDKKIVK